MPLKEPAVDQNADNDEFDQPIDFELGENDQPLGENDQPPEEFQTEDEEPIDVDELIAPPRRSARLAKIDGEAPCNDLIPTVPETFPKKKVQNEANTCFLAF